MTHRDLERVLQCSSHLAFKHAKAYGSVVMQRVESLKQEHVDPNTQAIATLETKIKALQDELRNLKPHVQANEESIRANGESIGTIKTDIIEIKNTLHDVEARIVAKDTKIQLDPTQYIRLRSDIWQSLSSKTM